MDDYSHLQLHQSALRERTLRHHTPAPAPERRFRASVRLPRLLRRARYAA